MSNKFNLGYLKPKGTVWHTLDRVHIPPANPNPARLELKPAGRGNPELVSALFKLQDDPKAADASSVDGLNASDARHSKIFAKHVIVGWDEVRDESMEPMPFSAKDVEELLVTIAIEQQSPDVVAGVFATARDLNNFRDDPVADGESLGKR